MIYFNNLKPALEAQRTELDEAIKRVLDNGIFINGPEVSVLENVLARYMGTAYSISCANGTDALILSLLALKHDPNVNEVITVANSAPATVAAIRKAGLTPIFVDILPNGLMNVDEAIRAINIKTLAIIPVHLFGQIVDTSQLFGAALEAGCYVIEDAAQAMGSKKLSENKNTVKCTSFYPTKNLGAFGDGGMIFSNSVMFANEVARLKNYGMVPDRNIRDKEGFNSRLDEIQAAILNVRLTKLEENNEHRRSLAQLYHVMLDDSLIHRPFNEDENYHLFTIRTPFRDGLKNFLKENGVETAIHYPVPAYNYLSEIMREDYNPLPETDKFYREILSLPLYPGMNMTDVIKVSDLIDDFLF